MTDAARVLPSPLPEGIGPNPYAGLLYFDQHNSHLFFGREGQTDALVARMAKSRFVAVVGTSGSGKSSLVRAGLLPSLWAGYLRQAGSDWLVADFRPGTDPIERLARELAKLGPFKDVANIEQKLRESSLGLVDLLRSKPLAGCNLLIVVDQFEEVFRFEAAAGNLRAHDERAAFVKLLLEATRAADVPLYVVMTMRSDFLGDCAAFRDLPEAISNGQFLIPRLTREQQRSAIEGPANVAGASICNRLVQRLLNDTAEGQDNDQLPLLQHALMRTWDAWAKKADGPIDLPHYEAIGTLSGALSKHADETFGEAASKARDGGRLLKVIFQRLSGKDEKGRETRRDCSIDELARVSGRSQDDVLAVIEPFRQTKRAFLMPLVRNEQLSADDRIDVTHECLIRKWEVLRDDWLPEEMDSARTYRKLVDRAEDGTPLAGKALALAMTWWQQHSPNGAWASRYGGDFDRVKRFKDRSARNWIFKAVAILLGVGVALTYAGIATANWFSAQKQGVIEQALRLAEEDRRAKTLTLMVARTAAALANDPNSAEAAALLGATAYLRLEHCAGSNEALDSSVRALQSLPQSTGHVEYPGAIKVAIAGAASVMAVADKSGTVALLHIPDLAPIGKVGAADEEPKQIELSADGTRLAIATASSMRIFNVGLGAQFSSELELSAPCPDLAWISLSRGGQDAIATCRGDVAYWYRWSKTQGWKQLKGERRGMGWVVDAVGSRASYLDTSDGQSFVYHIVDANQKALPSGRYTLPYSLGQWDVARANPTTVLWLSGAKTLSVVTGAEDSGGLNAGEEITAFFVGDSGQTAVASTAGGSVQLWTLADSTERLHVHFNQTISDLALDDTSGYLAVALENEVRLLQLSLSQRFSLSGVSANEAVSLAGNPALRSAFQPSASVRGDSKLAESRCSMLRTLTPDRSKLAFFDCERVLHLKEVADSGPGKTIQKPVEWLPRKLMASGDGSRLAVITIEAMSNNSQRAGYGSLARSTMAHLFEVEGGAIVEKRVEKTPEGSTFWELGQSGRTTWAITGAEPPVAYRLDFEKGGWQPLDWALDGRATAFAVSPKEDILVLASVAGMNASKAEVPSLKAILLPTLRPLTLVPADGEDELGITTSIAFSSDGAHVATADGSTVRIWSLLEQPKEVARVALTAPVTGLAFSLDNGQVTAVSNENVVSIPWKKEALGKAVCDTVTLGLSTVWQKYAKGEKQPSPICDTAR